MAVYLYPPTEIGLKAMTAHLFKPCMKTSSLASLEKSSASVQEKKNTFSP